MQTIELSWVTPKKIHISGLLWQPEGNTKGIIVLVHGIGEHIHRYDHVAKMYNDHQYAFLASDLSGHGKSEGQRGHADSFDDYFVQIDWMLAEAVNAFPGKPVVLYGHSLGANLVLRYLEVKQPLVTGAIISAPALAVTRVPPLKLALGKLMYQVYPRFTMTNSLDTSGLSHNPEIVETYRHDPLVHPLITARLGLDLINSSQLIINDVAKLSVPLLLLHGSADRLVNISASRDFASRCNGNLKYVEIPGGYHELHNEPNQQEVFAIWLDWLDRVIPQG